MFTPLALWSIDLNVGWQCFEAAFAISSRRSVDARGLRITLSMYSSGVSPEAATCLSRLLIPANNRLLRWCEPGLGPRFFGIFCAGVSSDIFEIIFGCRLNALFDISDDDYFAASSLSSTMVSMAGANVTSMRSLRRSEG